MMKKAAIIDRGGVLIRFTMVEDENWKTTKSLIPVPDACDLVPLRYRWDGAAFVPIAATGTAADTPQILRAIVDGFAAVRDAGVALPPSTESLIDTFAGSFDDGGA